MSVILPLSCRDSLWSLLGLKVRLTLGSDTMALVMSVDNSNFNLCFK